jgi:hypothetical protein
VPYFESRFPKVDFQISEMPIDLLGVETDPLPGKFQLPTPNKSIGPSEVARDCFKVGRIRLPLVGGRLLKKCYILAGRLSYCCRFGTRRPCSIIVIIGCSGGDFYIDIDEYDRLVPLPSPSRAPSAALLLCVRQKVVD